MLAACRILESVYVARDVSAYLETPKFRDLSLFVTFSYPYEIQADDCAAFEGGSIPDLLGQVAFVA